jgi:CBS-domain-containing membrane protein
MPQRVLYLLDVDDRPVSHAEPLVSLAGAFTGIFVVLATARLLNQNAPLIVASIGASATLFNWFFLWRGYPAALATRPAPEPVSGYEPIPHEDFVYALSQIDSFIDVSEQALARIYELATKRHSNPAHCDIFLGHYYSNAEFASWAKHEVVWDEGNWRRKT